MLRVLSGQAVHRPGGVLAAVAVSLATVSADAGGLEYPAPGTRALGRAGAFTARADDPMALGYNPAALADAPGFQALVNLHLAFYSACVKRSGTYTDNATVRDVSEFGSSERLPGAGGYAFEEFPKVCNEGPPGPGPAAAATLSLQEDLGVGFGVLAPVTAGSVRWGNEDGSVIGVNGERRPNPVRYMLLSSDGFVVFPTVAVGYRVLPAVRVGGALQWGVAKLDLLSYSVATGGENPKLDGRTEIALRDLFVPAAIASVLVTPLSGLDAGLTFRWSDDVRASADVDLVLGDFGTGEPDSTIARNNRFEDASVVFPMPWQVALGLRYGARRDDAPAGDRPGDPLTDEVWDVELDVVYELNSRVDEIRLRPDDDAVIRTRSVNAAGTVVESEVPAGTLLTIPHRWKNQLGLRLGGDVNVVRGLLALRAGVSYESRGVDPSYAQTDFLPAARTGLHGGATVRLGAIDVSVGYAHLFQETITANPVGSGADEAKLRQVAPDGNGRVINAGRYTGSWNVVSLGVGARL